MENRSREQLGVGPVHCPLRDGARSLGTAGAACCPAPHLEAVLSGCWADCGVEAVCSDLPAWALKPSGTRQRSGVFQPIQLTLALFRLLKCFHLRE